MSTLTAPRKEPHALGQTVTAARLSIVLVIGFAPCRPAHTVYSVRRGLWPSRASPSQAPRPGSSTQSGLPRLRSLAKGCTLGPAHAACLPRPAAGGGGLFYPTTFDGAPADRVRVVRNDVYTGLLMVATYLGVERLRRTVLAPGIRSDS